jgi:phosphatidylglycerol:prolipoprotein diacylglycerol transferase
MLVYPKFSPDAFSVGIFHVRWYGIMYLIGFAATWALGIMRSSRPHSPIQASHVSDALFFGALGVILGGRLGYVLFYNLSHYLQSPLTIFAVWDGGMSFHGGLIGVIIAMCFYCYKAKINVFDILDFFAPMVPIGLGLGRIGNFINDELWGRVTDSHLAMVFPTGGPLPRYPSQLIECFFEGIVLFLILWLVSMKPKPRMLVSALFLVFYAIFRFGAEFLRQPDPQKGFIAFNWLTMGQVLCIPMFLVGAMMLFAIYFKRTKKVRVS